MMRSYGLSLIGGRSRSRTRSISAMNVSFTRLRTAPVFGGVFELLETAAAVDGDAFERQLGLLDHLDAVSGLLALAVAQCQELIPVVDLGELRFAVTCHCLLSPKFSVTLQQSLSREWPNPRLGAMRCTMTLSVRRRCSLRRARALLAMR